MGRPTVASTQNRRRHRQVVTAQVGSGTMKTSPHHKQVGNALVYRCTMMRISVVVVVLMAFVQNVGALN
jgi:hypothetical protein